MKELPLSEIESYKNAIRAWQLQPRTRWERFKLWCKKRYGYDYCGRCRKLVKWKLVLHRLGHDHPPLFGTYFCPECDLAITSSPFKGWNELSGVAEGADARDAFADWFSD